MPESAPLSLSVGDRVVYPNQGVCRVSGVEAMEISGQRLTFVTMKREEDGAVVRVPQAKVQSIGLRKVATSDEVKKIFDFLKSDSDKADLDWKQRARTNVERMSAGGILGLAEVVKGLQVLSELRPLPTKERELYDNARHLLVSEIAVSLGIADCDAEDAIDIVLFPPGRDRPKRTAEEFKVPGGDEDELGDLGGDILGIEGGDLDLPADEVAAPEASAESSEDESAEEAGDEGDDEKDGAKPKKEKDKERDKAKAAAPRRAALSDDEETQPVGTALVPDEQLPPKRKRGRPPKPKPLVLADAPPPVPKKRGRPPKPKPAIVAVEAPKTRGRPPKHAPAGKKK